MATKTKAKEGKATSLARVTLFPVHNMVLFPHMIFPIKLQKKRQIELVEKVQRKEGYIGIIATKKETDYPTKTQDLHTVGTIANILKVIRLSQGEIVAIVQGQNRFSIDKIVQKKPHVDAQIKLLPDQTLDLAHKKAAVLIQSIKEATFKLVPNIADLPTEVNTIIKKIQNPDFFIHYIATSFIPFPETQQILALSSSFKRATFILKYLLKNLEFLKIQKQIHRKVHTDINLQQRKFYLKQQIKVLQEELGESPPDHHEEIAQLRLKGEALDWPVHVKQHFNKTLEKATRLHPSSAEYSNLLNYAETFSEIPWEPHPVDKVNLRKAQQILNKTHYGMEKVKERILTLLAVQRLKKSNLGKILCFHGPPGVGKTSLCKSIAQALGRKYARISLGGLHDEAELRGHRKTYVGAMMGQIMNAIKKNTDEPPPHYT